MKCFPIIPIWIMIIICIFLIIVILKTNKKDIIKILIIILLFLINLRIMIPSKNSQTLSNNLDVLFVIDNTLSMNTEDYDGNKTRMYALKKDCKYIMKRLNGAKFSIITFNNNARILLPYTNDINLSIEAIDSITFPSTNYALGSSLNTPKETIITTLKSSMKKDNRIRIIFFISDGEITDDTKLESYSEISKYIDNGAVLGYGTTKGGYIQDPKSYSDKTEYIKDYYNATYQEKYKAISKMDEENLKKIASDIGIKYINMKYQSKINKKLQEIKNLISEDIELNNISDYEDTYYILIIPLLILLLIEFNKIRRQNLWKQK